MPDATAAGVAAGLTGVADGRRCGAIGITDGGNGLAEGPGVIGAGVRAGRQLVKVKTARIPTIETILRKSCQLVTFILRHLIQ